MVFVHVMDHELAEMLWGELAPLALSLEMETVLALGPVIVHTYSLSTVPFLWTVPDLFFLGLAKSTVPVTGIANGRIPFRAISTVPLAAGLVLLAGLAYWPGYHTRYCTIKAKILQLDLAFWGS